mmetsp:Transcript_109598/g.315571  ORF Transcript_109598/g.315571 Transcript_109598/m.315571 type:complete len:268 (+) Transcript_109598:916-1719(+)
MRLQTLAPLQQLLELPLDVRQLRGQARDSDAFTKSFDFQARHLRAPNGLLSLVEVREGVGIMLQGRCPLNGLLQALAPDNDLSAKLAHAVHYAVARRHRRAQRHANRGDVGDALHNCILLMLELLLQLTYLRCEHFLRLQLLGLDRSDLQALFSFHLVFLHLELFLCLMTKLGNLLVDLEPLHLEVALCFHSLRCEFLLRLQLDICNILLRLQTGLVDHFLGLRLGAADFVLGLQLDICNILLRLQTGLVDHFLGLRLGAADFVLGL